MTQMNTSWSICRTPELHSGRRPLAGASVKPSVTGQQRGIQIPLESLLIAVHPRITAGHPLPLPGMPIHRAPNRGIKSIMMTIEFQVTGVNPCFTR